MIVFSRLHSNNKTVGALKAWLPIERVMQQWVEIAGSKFIVEIWEIYLQNVQNSKEYVKTVKKYKEIHINQQVVIST